MYRKDKKNEFYTKKAHEEGYAARSVYKLREIDGKYPIFQKGDRVLDLGAAPGSWMQYIARKVGDAGFVLGIDIVDLVTPLRRPMLFIKKDVMVLTADDLGSEKYNAVVSDLAPSTTGVRSRDSGLSLELAMKALEISRAALFRGGNFITKIFEGENIEDFQLEMEKSFTFVKRYRPQAVRRESRETYIIGRNFILHEGI